MSKLSNSVLNPEPGSDAPLTVDGANCRSKKTNLKFEAFPSRRRKNSTRLLRLLQQRSSFGQILLREWKVRLQAKSLPKVVDPLFQ